MYAGHLVLGTFALLTSVAMSAFFQSPELSTFLTGLPGILWMVFLIVMYLMELFVAVLQAYVFSMLSATYIQLATSDEH
jgi:F-type H+-transporting ATPase subunit a